ncbi:HD domain-containing protein [Komagataeibacter diospyri]|uniref:5'-deoxynucleotidase n=1 Tax=Komagataeibacter diospyri TaxID=1932662 RepID=A0A4P5NR53_9PROT|nr:HD domain-containing protein [Komagataeibacter diospyri]GCE84168.1 hypothetical protein MSKU9_2309 [Komagataeibacter diospyri]
MKDQYLTEENIRDRLTFLEEASRLKDVLRSSFTREAKPESTAEHSWSLCLMILCFADQMAGIDLLKLLKICILHDLGEALNGDIPAIGQNAAHPKSAQERADLEIIMRSLPLDLRNEFLGLWDEYENAVSPEARLAKAFDKLETISQHNSGRNPPSFNYTFNLSYGRNYTDHFDLTKNIRNIVDHATLEKIGLK